MKDAKCAESKEKTIFPIFVFRVMVIFILKSPQFSMNFNENFHENKNREINFISRCILFSKFRTFHKNLSISGGGEVCIFLVGTRPLFLSECSETHQKKKFIKIGAKKKKFDIFFIFFVLENRIGRGAIASPKENLK